MRKFNIPALAVASCVSAAGLLVLSACSGKNAGDTTVDTADVVEQVEEAPAAGEALADSTIIAMLNVYGEKVEVESDTILTTPTGLKYRVIKEGKGAKPAATDEVEVNYEGRLPNGEVFDSSYQRGETATFPLNQVIKGWTEGLQLMGEGAVYEFYIPSELAYGTRGAGDKIGPDQPLLFKVELIKVNPGKR